MFISPPIETANLGMADSLILMVMALVVFGPRRLPQIGRQIGKLMYEFRKASNDFKYQMEEELRNAEEADRRRREETERQLVAANAAVAQAQDAAKMALTAASQAQDAAQAALGAADANVPAAAETALPPSEPVAAENTGRSEPDMIYNYGYDQAAETPAAEPVEIQAAEPVETGLRVQPPSTGEQVPAARPGRAPVVPDAATAPELETAPEIENSLKKEVAVEEQPASTESAAHHG